MRRKDDDQEPAESPGWWDPGGIQFVRWPAEGAAKGKPSMLQRGGTRQLPEICWYLAECTVQTVKQGGIADKLLFVLDRNVVLSWAFLFYMEVVLWQIPREDLASTAVSMCRKF